MQGLAYRKTRLIGLPPPGAGRRQRRRRRRVGSLEALQHRFDPLVARGHLGLIDIVQFQSLRQGEDVLLPVVADQGRAEGLGRGPAARVAVGRQGVRIALAGHQSPEDAQARHARIQE